MPLDGIHSVILLTILIVVITALVVVMGLRIITWVIKFRLQEMLMPVLVLMQIMPIFREYIGVKLLTPLVIGVKYYVSFKACLSDNPSIVYASNKLGALFSTISYSVDSFCLPPCNSTLLPPKNFAQVYSDSIITDTANWTTISGSFIADSVYQYVIIGNHFDNTHTSVILLDSGTSMSVLIILLMIFTLEQIH